MAEINRKELKKQISNKSFSNLYLIFGDEKMYVKADTDLLVTKLMGKEPPEFNYHSFTDDYTMDDVAIAVQVMPFVSEYNCVKISDLDVNNLKKAEFDQFMSILENTPDTTVVIITLPTLMIDSKKKGANFTKLLNFVKKKGVACDIAQETDISLARQIVKWADSRGVKIEQADAYKLQEYVGFDLNSIRNELDKLCNYIGDGELITEEHIEMLTTKRLEANIFHLSDAIVQCNSTKAYEIIDVLMYQKIEL
jgi:DNA polymerase-3 subunit delta